MSEFTLYELSNRMLELQALIENHEGDMTDILLDTEEMLEMSLDDKLEGIMKVRQNKLAKVDAFKQEENRLAERRKREEKEISKLEQYLEAELTRLGYNYKEKKKREVGTFAIQFKKLPPKLEIVNPDKIPFDYMNIPVVQPTPDKKELLDFLKKKVAEKGLDIKTVDEFAFDEYGIKLVNNGQKVDFK